MTDYILEAPRKLERRDDRSTFCSGSRELDTWFQQYAWQNQKANNAVVYVTTRNGEPLGYYAIATASYCREDAPQKLGKGRPSEIPAILLARLAVDQRAQRHGIGAALLKDALQRSLALSQQVGTAAFIIHCRDESAKAFYLANGNFAESPANPLHLLLSFKQIRAMIPSS